MSLHIYTSTDLIPNGIKYEMLNDVYFNKHHLKLPDTEEVRFLLKYIEEGEYHTEKTFIGKFVLNAGILNRFLSTGTKTALNILLSKDVCFDTMSCGENAPRGIIYIIYIISNSKEPICTINDYINICILMHHKTRLEALSTCEMGMLLKKTVL